MGEITQSVGVGGPGIFSVVKVLKFFSIFFSVGFILLGIFNSVMYGITKHIWKPLWDNTLGRILASDNFIKNSMILLKDKAITLDASYVDYLKKEILFSFIIIIVMIFLLWRLLMVIFGGGWSLSSPLIKVAFVFLAIFLLFTLQMIYVTVYKLSTDKGDIDFGFKGTYMFVKDLIFDRSVFLNSGNTWSTVGLENTTNSTLIT